MEEEITALLCDSVSSSAGLDYHAKIYCAQKYLSYTLGILPKLCYAGSHFTRQEALPGLGGLAYYIKVKGRSKKGNSLSLL